MNGVVADRLGGEREGSHREEQGLGEGAGQGPANLKVILTSARAPRKGFRRIVTGL
mgnify:CR=1 FL=1